MEHKSNFGGYVAYFLLVMFFGYLMFKINYDIFYVQAYFHQHNVQPIKTSISSYKIKKDNAYDPSINKVSENLSLVLTTTKFQSLTFNFERNTMSWDNLKIVNDLPSSSIPYLSYYPIDPKDKEMYEILKTTKFDQEFHLPKNTKIKIN